MFERLRSSLEGYRWLWSAQRRWRPSALPIACILFAARVVMDLARSFSRPLALGGGTAIVVAVIAFSLAFESPGVDTREWSYAQGGFDIVFSSPWRRTETVEMASLGRFGEALPGSTHRRRVKGGLRPSYVTVQAYEIGDIGSTHDVAASLLGPNAQTLWRPTTLADGVHAVAYRLEEDGEGEAQAALVFWGRDMRGFAIGVQGNRDDEDMVLAEASLIADSIRHHGKVVADFHLIYSSTFGVSRTALERVRYLAVTPGEPRDSSLVRIMPLSMPDATAEECRAAAVDHYGRIPVALSRTHLRAAETQLLCANSSVAVRLTFGSGQLSVRQVDERGTVIFAMIQRLFQPDPWRRVLVPPPDPSANLVSR